MALWTQVATGSGTGTGSGRADSRDFVQLVRPEAGTLYGIAVVANPAIALFLHQRQSIQSKLFQCGPVPCPRIRHQRAVYRTRRSRLAYGMERSITVPVSCGQSNANTYSFSITNSTPTCTPGNQYAIAQIGGTIVPGTVDTGNHCDDCTTPITLPFPYTLHDQTFTTANVDSNGTLQFVSASSIFSNSCLPDPSGRTYIIFPYWDDGYTINSGFGIFTSISGTAPNRIFNIEWRNQYFPGTGTANYEVRLYEGQTRFDVIYGQLDNGNTSATAGVQKVTDFTQYFCNGSGGAATGGQSYTLQGCGTPTPSPTATATATATATTTGTPSPTPTCSAGGAHLVRGHRQRR